MCAGVTKDPVATSRPATAASSRSRRNWGRPATAYQPPSTREPPWGLDLDQLIHSSNAATQRQVILPLAAALPAAAQFLAAARCLSLPLPYSLFPCVCCLSDCVYFVGEEGDGTCRA